MKKYVLGTLCAILFIISVNHFFFNSKNDKIIKKWAPQNDVVEMPIVLDSRSTKVSYLNSAPIEQRDKEFANFLSASVKIRIRGSSGSGTIFYYDHIENWAYVISCGHLWSGNSKYDPDERKEKAEIIVWFNEEKLSESKSYEAEVLFYSNDRGYDCSCMRFKPDWIPNYYPIAPVNYEIKKGEELNSLGCDGGSEVARYAVKFVEYRGEDLITEKNSPRPGRSGGGLITDSGWYVGICWGTSDTTSGNGIGYFTPLNSIHKTFETNNLYYLLTVNNLHIPIYDWENPNKKYEINFVPQPVKTLLDFSFLK